MTLTWFNSFDRLFVPLLKEVPKHAVAHSHQLLLRGGYIWQAGSGLYALLPMANRVVQRLQSLVRAELNAIGSQECVLPAITDKHLWQQSGRWQEAGDELFRLEDRKGAAYCLAATHEETVTALVSSLVSSHRSLPLYLYQMQPKYRDEMRPRYGLLRCREFMMKDMYTFDSSEQDARATYAKVVECYQRILQRLGVPFAKVQADTGLIGGSLSHEFQIKAEIGEDELIFCDTCNQAANIEKIDGLIDACPHASPSPSTSPRPPSASCSWTTSKGIEVGHAFLLGTKYSTVFDAAFLDADSQRQDIHMGCYGLGLTRMLSAVAEAQHDAEGLIWPIAMAPFVVSIASVGRMNTFKDEKCRALYEVLNSRPELSDLIVLDTRDMSPRHKLANSRMVGIPFTVLVGDWFDSEHLEVYARTSHDKQDMSVEEFVSLLSSPALHNTSQIGYA
ncbi:prolyl-tRNA synthetase [Salpingoeca rosetta]|uniref:Probable proline--tRNA ligase, mitochondrial n=1 Tax=Salpingoeca rosetta (strain ATCC 50818 / BSB-021) TaxID=946362 RepID=F2TWI2_SALR5|nr:prolyl-tRNA synthetase [Salpingoeca rosetta]EGD72428.1 prolyl-tRNA synthetase [Salpingoeca rosetta]|eukprot:XP_004998997.1 prolyl-tRNA synthetase [Salpingoeca rosetta]